MDELDRTLQRLDSDDIPLPGEDETESQADNRPRFRFVQAGNLQFSPPRFVVRGFIEADSLGLFFGDPGSGKSFAALDMACAIATGNDWHGARVEQGPVVYVAGEGQNGLRRRIAAWEIARSQPLGDAPLFVSTAPAALCDVQSAAEVAGAVDDVAEEHGSPKLAVIDTLARNFGPGDENATRDMSAFIGAADMIRASHACAVLIVHHAGHGDKTRARGAIALKGALDSEFRIDKDENGAVRLEATKMKEAPLPEPLAFELRTVELGLDDDEGEPVTSAVLDPVEYSAPIDSSEGNRGQGKNQRIALSELHRLYSEHRDNVQASGRDPNEARVSLSDWRHAMKVAGVPRQRTYDVTRSLEHAGRVEVTGRYVRPAE